MVACLVAFKNLDKTEEIEKCLEYSKKNDVTSFAGQLDILGRTEEMYACLAQTSKTNPVSFVTQLRILDRH